MYHDQEENKAMIFYTLIILLFAIVLFMTGCSSEDKPYRNFYIVGQQGKAPLAQCRGVSFIPSKCGVSLWDCTNGREYTCLTNIEERPSKGGDL